MSLKDFLLNALETGEHAIQVVGVGGITQIALNHDSFIQKLIEAIQAYETAAFAPPVTQEQATALANTPAIGVNSTPHLADTLTAVAPAMNPVPTSEQIAQYLRENPTAGMTMSEASPTQPGESSPEPINGAPGPGLQS